MITVSTPDGGVATFPDGMSKEEIQAIIRRKFPVPQTVNEVGKESRERPLSETLGDVGMSAAQGFQSGFQSMLGMPGDIQELAGKGASWGAGKLGFSPEVQEGVKSLGLPQLPTTPDVNRAFESVIGPKYQSQTDVGRYVGAVGEMVPSALTGPGGFIRKGAMAVVPGVAMEATKDVTEGNPAAEAAAGVAASILTAGRGGGGTKQMLKDVDAAGKQFAQTTGQKTLKGVDAAHAAVRSEADKAYGALRSAGIQYDQQAIDNAIADVSTLRTHPDLSPMAHAYKDDLSKFMGKGMDFEDLDELEQVGTSMLRDKNVSENDKRLIGAMLSKVRNIRETGSITTNGSINPADVSALVARAKDFGRRNILARDIKGMEDKSKWYLGGDESGLRNKFASYGRSKGQNLSKAEEQAFLSVVKREGALNPLHSAGTRLGQAALGTIGYTSGGLLGAIGTVAGSATARKFMEVYTKQGVEKAIKTVLAGRPAQERAAILDLLEKQQARTRAAISSTAAVQNGSQNWVVEDAQGNRYDAEGNVVKNAGGRVARKSGGKVSANPISAEVKRVRALLSEKTASMLSVPDDAIATALHLAKGQ